MKRIRPVGKQTEVGYPTPEVWGASRREFLRVTLRSAAALGAGVVLSGIGDDVAAARTRRERYHATWFRLRRAYRFPRCDSKVTQIYVQSSSRGLIDFVRRAKERDGIDTVIRGVLAAASCATIQDRNRLARLEARLARALRAHFRARTRRSVAQPIVTLKIERAARPLPGRPPVPHYPPRP
jgi:hypothetical protein